MSTQAPSPRPHRGSQLLPDPSYQIQRRVAEVFGDIAAHVFHQLDWYLTHIGEARTGGEPDDRRWVLATYDDWHDEFTWYCQGSIGRAVRSLEKMRVIVTVHVRGGKNAKWYTIDYARFDEIFVGRPEEKKTRGLMRRFLNLSPRPSDAPKTERRKSARPRALQKAERAQCQVPRLHSVTSGRDIARAPEITGSEVATLQGARSLSMDGRIRDDVDDGSSGSAGEPTPTGGVLPPSPELLAALAAAEIADPQIIAQRFPAASPRHVRKLHRLAKRLEQNGRLRGTVSGYVITGLRDGYLPEPPKPAPRPAAAPEPPRPIVTDNDLALVKLPPEEFEQLAADVLAEAHDFNRGKLARLGPGSNLYRALMVDKLERGWTFTADTTPRSPAGASAPAGSSHITAPLPTLEGGAPCPQ